MKISYDAQIFSEQKYGGVSRYFCEIAPRISVLQDTQVVITAPMHINSYLEHLPSRIVSGFRLPYAYKINCLSPEIRVAGMLIGDLMLRLASPDIIHETYYFPYRLGPRHARRVLTIHDMIHEKFAHNFDPNDKTSRFKLMAAKRADHIICVSESTRRDLIELTNINPDKTSVVYHGFGLMNYSGTKSITPFSDEPFLLYVGSRRGYKNFLGLLNAYGESTILRKHCKLVCFGGGRFDRDELKTIKGLGLSSDNVIHLSGDDHILCMLYKTALAFVYPSLYEGFGIPPLESMSFDCPVVCSNAGSVPEVVGDAGEYFNPNDIDAMRDAIERTVESINLRNLLIANGRNRLKLFSWDRCAQETVDVYRKLA